MEKKTYRIAKYNPNTDKWEDYGRGYSAEDVKAVTKGYKNEGLFYSRKGSKVLYEVRED